MHGNDQRRHPYGLQGQFSVGLWCRFCEHTFVQVHAKRLRKITRYGTPFMACLNDLLHPALKLGGAFGHAKRLDHVRSKSREAGLYKLISASPETHRSQRFICCTML